MTDFFDTPVDLTLLGGPVRLYRGGEVGPPVVLLHGAMFDTGRGVWHDVAPVLAERYRVHVVDLPRHGGSRPWRGMLDQDFFLRFVDALLDSLELPRAALVGLSMGGGVAAGYAVARPERVTALVAIGPGGLDAVRPYQFLTWLLSRTPGLLQLTSLWLARSPGSVRASLAGHLVAGERTPGFDRIVDIVTEEAQAKWRHREKAMDDWQIAACGPRVMRLHLTPTLGQVTAPILWLRGDRDPLVSEEVLAAAHAATPGSRLVAIPEAGHVASYDQPELVSSLIRDFLDETLAAE